ncbi:MAG TPA: transporter substrate-binding domain-containing protein [Burkholderiales bacterium]|nr:transporter substrate-binding domain-containing protein [Burkholderiales bacterium]
MKFSFASALVLVAGLCAPLVWAQQNTTGTDPDEITDTLQRSKAKGVLNVCAYPYQYPFTQQNSDPPGFDIEIIRNIAKQAGMRTEVYWIVARSRASNQRVFRDSILAKRCDVFLSLGDAGDDDEDMLMNQLTFTKPMMSMAYILVTQGKADGMKTIEEVSKAGIKIGVNMSTPADAYLFDKKIDRSLYFGDQRVMEGMAKGEIDAALIFAPSFAEAKRRYPDAKFHIAQGYEPLPEHRFNMRYAVRKGDKSLLDFINKGIDELLANGKIKQTVESYNVPFFAPLS